MTSELSYINKGYMNKLVEIECPECFGNGIVEDRKGKESTCTACKGKGTLYEKVKEDLKEPELSNTQGDSN